MTVLLTLEASQPSGKTYRLGFGCKMQLASGFDDCAALAVVLSGMGHSERGALSLL
jgi:hypothetical protein